MLLIYVLEFTSLFFKLKKKTNLASFFQFLIFFSKFEGKYLEVVNSYKEAKDIIL